MSNKHFVSQTGEHHDWAATNQTRRVKYIYPLLAPRPSFWNHHFFLPPPIFVVNFILLIKLRKQSWFTVNLIKAACLRRIPLCTAKSNLLSIRFTQRSIHLHWRLLGTICGYLGLRERGERRQGRWGEQSEERGEKIERCGGKKKGRLGDGRRAGTERNNDDHRWRSLH